MRARRTLAMALPATLLAVAWCVSAPVPKGRPGGDWPQWRGPNRDGHSPAKGLLARWPDGGPKLLWRVENPDLVGVGYGSVSVVGGRVFVLGADPPDAENKSTAEYCTCLRASDGTKLWRTKIGMSRTSDSYGAGPASAPTVAGDRVFALGSSGDLVSLLADSGEEKWRLNLTSDLEGEAPSFGFSECPLVDGDRVVVSPGGKGGMAALNAATGKTVWQCKDITGATGYSSAITVEVGGIRQYVRQTSVAGYGVRASDGKLLWKVKESERGSNVIPTAVATDGHVFFTNSGECECVKLEKDGDGVKAVTVYAKNKKLTNYHGGVIALGDKLFGFTAGGNQWVCFPFKSGGDPTWKAKGIGSGSIIHADGHFYCYAEKDGTCALVRASETEYPEVGRLTLPANSTLRPGSGGVFAHPAIAAGRLYLRDYEKLFVYDIAAR